VSTVEQLKDVWRDDFPAFTEDALKITTKDGELVPFRLNRAQRALWDIIDRIRKQDRPVRVFVLKARQLGFSTMTQALAYWRATLWSNSNALIVSHELESANALFLKSKMFQALIPAEVRPMQKLNNRRELHFENPDPAKIEENPGLNSRIIVQTADNAHLGASLTLQFVHLSEFARYEQIRFNVNVAMATLMQTVPRRKNTYVIIETTAQGFGYAKDFWDRKDDGYEKVFISWVADEMYTASTPLRLDELSDIEDSKYGDERYALELVLEELRRWYPEITDDAARMTEALKRLRWRRETLVESCAGDLSLFRQEYPLTADEAFLHTGTQVFDTRKLADIREAIEASGVQPKRYRYDKEFKGFYEASHGPLRVYEDPVPGKQYVIGADAAEGLERGDNAAAVVLSVPDLQQVAVYQEPIAPDDFADLLALLGRKYNKAWVCPEANGPGFATVLRMTKVLYYPYVYRRQALDAQTKKYVPKYGFHTNRASKTVLITDLRGALRDDLLLFRDLDTLEELAYYQQGDDGKFGAASGKRDDLVIATALAVQMSLERGFSRLGKGALGAKLGEEEKEPYVSPFNPKKYTFEWWARLAEEEGFSG
jgi:hypothetical protein